MTKQTEWVEYSDNPPKSQGWYALHYFWDAVEGSWVESDFFDGQNFEKSLPVTHISSVSFSNKELADHWANENDIST